MLLKKQELVQYNFNTKLKDRFYKVFIMMLVQLGTVWCFAIPAGFIAAAYFKLPLNKVYFIICLEEVIKIGFEAKRLHSKKWIRSIV